MDLAVKGNYWLGAAVGGALSGVLLSTRLFHVDVGWRLGFGLSGSVGLFIVVLRRVLPESPRWLVTHGNEGEADAVLAGIEDEVARSIGEQELPSAEGAIRIQPRAGHYFVSLLIHSGASVKTVQKLVGHESAVETLDMYGHWWPDQDDATRAAVDGVLGTALSGFASSPRHAAGAET